MAPITLVWPATTLSIFGLPDGAGLVSSPVLGPCLIFSPVTRNSGDVDAQIMPARG